MTGTAPDPAEREPVRSPFGPPGCDRRFPDPDSMFRFIDPDEGPGSFWEGLPHDERSRRLRVFLIAVCADEAELMAWLAAIDFEPSSVRMIHELIDVTNRDDAKIVDMVRRHARDRWPSIERAFTLRRQRALRAMVEERPA